jgi:uncharacterized protein YndB with AHSA1/START domain
MPRASASRELLASRDDVWRFVSEPHHFADWWPGIAGVHPDRRGFVEGARWQVNEAQRPTLFRKAAATGLLLVRVVQPPEVFAWTLTGRKVDAELRLEELPAGRTTATLAVEAPWLYGVGRALPAKALTRLHDLCQTGAEV